MPHKEKNRAVVERKQYGKPANSNVNGVSYLLAIAIDNYEHHPKLANAVKDAEDIIQILVNRYAFEEKNITRLYNETASKPGIFSALEQLAQKITPIDNVLIYYAGHGYFHKTIKTGHLIPQNAKGKVWEFLSNADLIDNIRAINSLHTFLMLDSCFSGALFVQTRKTTTSNNNLSTVALAERVNGYTSRWCLAAGRIEEVEDGLHGENSPFAQAVLTFLQKNKEAKFPVSSLIQYVKKVTSHNAKQTPIGGILFKTKDLGGEFVFELKKDEVFDWEITLNQNTIIAYDAFLMNYPEGKYKVEALSRIKQLKSTTLWQQINVADDSTSIAIDAKLKLINRFLENHEDAPNYEQLLDIGELLDYKKEFLQAQTSIYALRRFIRKKSPSVEGANEIKASAKQLIKEWQLKEAQKTKPVYKAEKIVPKTLAKSNEISNKIVPALPLYSDSKYIGFDLSYMWSDSTINKIYISKHCAGTLGKEIFGESLIAIGTSKPMPVLAGLLLGTFHLEGEGYTIYLERFVKVEPKIQEVYEISFDEGCWDKLNDARDEFPDLTLISWFHTHPGHTCFLSRPDLNIQLGQFKKPYHFAFEIDTLSENLDMGFFTWKKGYLHLPPNTSDLASLQAVVNFRGEGETAKDSFWFSWKVVENFVRMNRKPNTPGYL